MQLSEPSFKDQKTMALQLIVENVNLSSTDLSSLVLSSLPAVSQQSSRPYKPVSPQILEKFKAYSGWQTIVHGL